MDWGLAIKESISLWFVIDPIGSIPIFIAVTAGLSATSSRMIAVKSTLIATIILLFFIVAAHCHSSRQQLFTVLSPLSGMISMLGMQNRLKILNCRQLL